MSRIGKLGSRRERFTAHSISPITFLSTYPPVKCGLATYSTHLIEALERHDPRLDIRVAAVHPETPPAYDSRVHWQIPKESLGGYLGLADELNRDETSIISLQHEYGIFGGDTGRYILPFLERLRKPVVTTLHTVLSEPSREQRSVLQEVARLSQAVVVMSEKGAELLQNVYRVPTGKTYIIPHGAPQGIPSEQAKAKLGLKGKKVISTFGLLSRGKGLEYAIEAFARVAPAHPDAIYLIIGSTHPNVLAWEGESYREELLAQVRRAGLDDRVRFLNRYLSERELVEWLSATDIYLTPYVNGEQITSGTLAYAIAQGKAVISTPYLYALEILSEGRGLLARFRDADSIAENLALLLDHPEIRRSIEERAEAFGRPMLWSNVAALYGDLFRRVRRQYQPVHSVLGETANLGSNVKRSGVLPAVPGWRDISGPR